MTRARAPHALPLTALLLLSAAPLGAQAAGGEAGQRSAAAGVYTEAQAQRGEAAFRQNCAACHTLGDFTGELFLKRWPTVGGLFEIVSATMPQDFPGGLTPQQYADILAYVLARNDFPAGPTELPAEAEALARIQIPPPGR